MMRIEFDDDMVSVDDHMVDYEGDVPRRELYDIYNCIVCNGEAFFCLHIYMQTLYWHNWNFFLIFS